MPGVFVSPLANADLLDVWLYVADDSEDAADHLLDQFAHAFEELAQNPGLGWLREDLGCGLRSLPVKTHLIFYRPVPDGVEVARVLSGYRDLAALL